MKKAFSLVELSIVLVILGLLVGAILAGQSLIRAAELRKVTRDAELYRTAFLAFRDKYFSWPGDMPNATSFWGKDNTTCSGQSGAITSPGTCNGDGDGVITFGGSTASASYETTRVWQHLALAGLIAGNYPGINNSAVPFILAGYNVPSTLNASTGITVFTYNIPYILFEIGTPQPSGGTYINTNALHGPAFVPEDAWNIDTKMDDGLPTTGKWTANNPIGTCYSGNQYSLVATAPACALLARSLN